MGLERQNACPRKKRRIQFETRIFRCRANENNGSIFHDRQKTVLLGLVEAVNFVDEQTVLSCRWCVAILAASNTFFRSATPEKIADICSKARSGFTGQQAGNRCLAGSGRSPENQTAKTARTDHPGQRAVLPGQMFLTHHLAKGCWAASARPAGL